jgi:hypothetical protein
VSIEHRYLTIGDDAFLTIGEDAFLTLGYTGSEGQELAFTGTWTFDWTETSFTVSGVGHSVTS